MQVSDNATATITDATPDDLHDPEVIDPTEVVERPLIQQTDPTEASNGGKVGGSRHSTHGFKPGNQLWKQRAGPLGITAARRALREAFHKALTPKKMAKAVGRMLTIINGKDPKAAVAAFKVLAETGCLKGETDSNRSGPSFVFVLPGPGAIPEGPVNVREGQLRQTLPALEVVDVTAEPLES